MSKTSQENKVKKTKKVAQEAPSQVEGRKASAKTKKSPTEVNPNLSAVVETEAKVNPEETATQPPAETETKVRQARVRGKKYQAAKKLVDINKFYPLTDAVKLVKTTSISKFEGKVEAHINVLEIGNLGEIVFPHLDLGAKKIVILNDAILAEIKDGKINFDILIATPVTMTKLLPFARLLGPKGLMPNPKSGTLTDKPEEAVKKLSVAKTMVKTEKKAPVIHIIVGKTAQPEKELAANLAELIKVIKVPRIKKLAICATMGPSIKIEIKN